MADYGQALEFGYFLVPDNDDPPGLLETARLLDRLGFDLIGIQDHPYQSKQVETMALIAMILAQTERVRLFPDVANLPLRPPSVLAKMAATLDQLSEGRFELGLGAGGFWGPIKGMGGPVRSPGEALAALAEAIEVIRLMWSGERSVRFQGEHYQLAGARPGSAPLHDIGIWIGVTGPRALALTGRTADGWIPSMAYVPPSAALTAQTIIDNAAREAGRDPAAIRRIYNVGGRITNEGNQPATDDDKQIIGDAAHWTQVLTHLAVDVGFSSFIVRRNVAAARN